MYGKLIEQAERYLKSLNTGDNIAAQLKRRLADLMARGEANADAACRALQLSRRTFQRRLKAEKTSFQRILKEVRAELAVRYLSDERLKALEVAMLLGYSNFSSFTTAFKSPTWVPSRSVMTSARSSPAVVPSPREVPAGA